MKHFNNLCNENKKISSENCIKLVQLLGHNPSKKQANDALKACEIEHGDEVDLELAKAFVWSVLNEIQIGDDLRAAFDKFDKDKNGYLDQKEFRIAMGTLGESLTLEELDKLMELFDVNKDGKIQYEGSYF